MNTEHILKQFQGFTRIRVGAILICNEQILTVKQKSIISHGSYTYLPPGGGVEFKESLESAVARECFEETGIHVNVGPLLYINEFIHDQYHAIELFFHVDSTTTSEPISGRDPELEDHEQLIQSVQWLPIINLPDTFAPAVIKHRLSRDFKNNFTDCPVWFPSK